jgi:hypothetical protein
MGRDLAAKVAREGVFPDRRCVGGNTTKSRHALPIRSRFDCYFRFATWSFVYQPPMEHGVSIESRKHRTIWVTQDSAYAKGRRRMQRLFLKTISIALLMGSAAYGQSLGEIARENRAKQQQTTDPAEQPKVITNANLPKDPNPNPAPAPSEPVPQASTASIRAADRRTAQERVAEQRATGQWKGRIIAQQDKVTNLQGRIDLLRASIRAENGSTQYEGPNGRSQARQMQRVSELQQQLDEQKFRLNQMQEAARRAGMHTVVYDP